MKENQKREKLSKADVDLSRFFELAITANFSVNKLHLHEIKKKKLLQATKDDFELYYSMIIGPNEYKNNYQIQK